MFLLLSLRLFIHLNFTNTLYCFLILCRFFQRVIGAVAGLGVVGTLAAAVAFFDLWDRFTAEPVDKQAARAVSA